MAIFSGSVTGPAPASASPIVDLEAPIVDSARLLEFGMSLNAAGGNTTNVGIGYCANSNSAQSNALSLAAEEITQPSSAKTSIGTAWSIAPLSPTVFFRRAFWNSVYVNAYVIYTFPRGLSVVQPAGNNLVAWMIAAAVVANFGAYAVVDE